MTPAILYAAKSSEDKRGSIPTQLDDARSAAIAAGREVVAEYSDEAASAFSGDRGAGLKAALDHAERLAAEHGSCALVVQHSDRLARGDGKKAAHLVEYALWALKHDVEIISVQDAQTFGDLLYAVVTGQRNHEDSARKSAAVKSGMARRAQRGQYNGGRPPYGYHFEGPNGERYLVIVEAEAVIVIRIFEEYVAGRSLGMITRGLNHDGVRTQRGEEWRQGTITKMLANPMYVGRLRFNGEVVDGSHPPIISGRLWGRVQALRAANSETPSKGRGRPPRAEFLLRGLLRCARCAGPMATHSETKHGKVYAYYVCDRRRRLGAEACDQESIRRERIDGAVFERFAADHLDLEATRRELEAVANREVAETRELRAQGERDERQAAEALERIERDYLSGDLSAASYERLRERAASELDAARAKVTQLRDREREVTEARVRDAEGEVLQRMAEIRAAVLGEIQQAGGVEAVRAALMRLFREFRLTHDPDGDYELQVAVRADALSGWEFDEDDGWVPVFRESLAVGPKTNTPSAARSCGRSSAAAAGRSRTGRAARARS